jgi:S1-C subfamily serine protease
MRLSRSLQVAFAAGLLSATFGAGRWLGGAPAGPGLRAFSNDFKTVSEAAGPAIVSVRSFERGARWGRRQRAQGSGVIVRADGVIVTNNHVVADAVAQNQSIRVGLNDGREFTARVLGTDRDTDLAVLKVESETRLDALELGADPEMGEWVLALGNPFGLGHTVTAGIISGTGRSSLGIATYEDFLQTDAAINPGNSGGALVNLDGDLVGINTAIGTPADGSQGIGFAIPSYMVGQVVDAIVTKGRVRRGYLGVYMRPPTAVPAARSYQGASQVAIQEIVDDSPAARAGLAVGDVILAVQGKTVTTDRQAMSVIAGIDPGREIVLDVWRGGRELQLPVVLTDRPR